MKDCLGGSSQSTSAFKSSKRCKYDVNAVSADYKGYILHIRVYNDANSALYTDLLPPHKNCYI